VDGVTELHTLGQWDGLTYKDTFYLSKHQITRMWANAQRDGCPAKHRWRPLFNAAQFG